MIMQDIPQISDGVMQRGKNPLLQNGSKMRVYLAKRQTHAQGGLDIDHRGFGLKVLGRVEDLHENRRLASKRCRGLHIASL